LPFEEITFKKTHFPFKLCTTTFIYPADWETNARALGRSFDELELLLFESAYPDSLPTPETIRALAELSEALSFSWNVHLPIDIYPGHSDRSVRAHAVETIRRTMDRVAPLTPTTHTLHLPGISSDRPDKTDVLPWLDRLHESLTTLAASGITGRSLTIENIPNYHLEIVLPLIETFDLGICLDVGHLVLSGASPGVAVEKFKNRISLMHLHGVAGRHDHRGLEELSPEILAELLQQLRDFTGVVSLEVFSKKRLLTSLDCLRKAWGDLLAGGHSRHSTEP